MKSSIAALIGGASTALAAVKGFNYAAQEQTRSAFEASFRTAAALEGTEDYTSARLYTMIQEGTTNTPIEAIPAAIDTQTTLLLGLWTSSPQSTFDNEIVALKSAISQYGSAFADLVVGISVGSEDLYRISATGIANDPLGVGQTPDVLVNYIGQVRKAIEGTSLSGKPIGHVDTWNAFLNSSNSAVIAACDFLGLDEYPYFQTTDPNSIENGKELFFEAYDKVQAVAPGKQIWVTEAGWPTVGAKSGDAVASIDNAEIFWQDVACELEDRNIDFWWYILEDTGANPSFGVSQGGKPLYNLACNATSSSNSTSSHSTTGGNSTSTGSSTNSTSSGYHNGTASTSSTTRATGTGISASSSASATSGSGSGSGSSGSSATRSGSASSPSVSSYISGAAKVEGTIVSLIVAAIMAALAL
ncbi:hypothetical protein LTS08_007719 [Lithohypha guttulata]|nr:hypothetical protein LTS08_007719 [Lithohypha guttulata]